MNAAQNNFYMHVYRLALQPVKFISLVLLALCFAAPALADSLFSNTQRASLGATDTQKYDFLPAEQAFQVSGEIKDNLLHFSWLIADGYYLYKHRFQFTVESPEGAVLGEPQFSQAGKPKKDPTFGDVTAFYHQVDITLALQEISGSPLTVKVRYQGCADQGLCYLPQKQTLTFAVPTTNNAGVDTSSVKKNSRDTESATGLASILAEKGFLFNLGLFFILGVGLCFTPCVLPMVPILSSIIIGQGERASAIKGFLLSGAYVLGMASTYAIAGMIVGVSGEQIQVILQQPAVLFSFAAIFIVLSLSMFGFYELQLPNSLQSKLNAISQKQQGGTLISAALMGVLAALIASPCVSAPLMGALLYIGHSGDMWFGGAALLALGLGMGAPLVVLGTTGANALPKAGPWMDKIKAIFGVLLLATGLWLTKHLVPDSLEYMLWGFLLILASIYLGAFENSSNHKHLLFRAIAISTLVAGAALIFHSINGYTLANNSADNSISHTGTDNQQNPLPFEILRDTPALEAALQDARDKGQPVMLDYFAEWCTSCIEMEHTSFSDPTARQLLSGHRWLQIDLTNNDHAKKLLDRYQLIGPPAILFFDENGKEINQARIYAYKAPKPFIKHLQQLFQ
ncbi:MAG: hypothetical protein CSA49_00825 [Gammaproteobacteria bacterium]|nr:MAG: hypothetical protein CSA49_00825 [Gammaproteobacteria bacterium]